MSVGPIRPSSTAHTVLHPVTPARISGGFWAARRRTDAEAGIPQGPAGAKRPEARRNLRAAATGDGGFTGDFPFQDSDVHKWPDAVSWRLADPEASGDRQLACDVDRLTGLLGAAQEPDGHLQTYCQVARPERRRQELDRGHELYCAGHLIHRDRRQERRTAGPRARRAGGADGGSGPRSPWRMSGGSGSERSRHRCRAAARRGVERGTVRI
ncbi:beta-L-arabinofuranosidase domain-containing protein [Streptomyces atratus]|uniref:beta-L-arabinofuranosidase domain-containing protein n=1 Tax=Streptomyces atratus TaxID=1893 RepID=UPI0033DB896E